MLLLLLLLDLWVGGFRANPTQVWRGQAGLALEEWGGTHAD